MNPVRMTGRVFGIPPANFDKEATTHAWDWFEFHANQRMTMIRFYLTIAGAIAAGVGFLWVKELYVLTMLLSIYGALASFSFLRLDGRVSDLVELGENALKAQQRIIACNLGDGFNICERADWRNQPCHPAKKRYFGIPLPYSYGQNFRFMFVVTIVGFGIMAFVDFWSEVNYLGTQWSY